MVKHFVDRNFQPKSVKTKSTDFLDAFTAYLLSRTFLNFSGLIFTGYGEKDLFPKLVPYNVSLLVNKKLRYFYNDENNAEISDHGNAAIRPFAQTDVIDTILKGISPDLQHINLNLFGDFTKFILDTVSKVPGMPHQAAEEIRKIDPGQFVNEYNKRLSDVIRAKQIDPLMDAVSHLSKEDLAEMAESLVYLTYLKRRFTMTEESVGGPVDIAVITKGDGFIWIKRKHYFDPELNQSFFKKYF